MGYLALCFSVAACIAAALPNPGMFVAMALGILAVAAGYLGYRRRADAGWCRLAGAAAMAFGGLGLVLAGGKYALTLAALRRLESLV